MGDHALDLIQELRLRTWARQNYIPSPLRTPEIHPVALEEMSKLDGDHKLTSLAQLGMGIVPLVPDEMRQFSDSRHLARTSLIENVETHLEQDRWPLEATNSTEDLENSPPLISIPIIPAPHLKDRFIGS